VISLPAELGDAGALIKRFQRADTNMQQWQGYLEDCFRYTAPNRNTFTDKTAGTSRHKDVYDSTAVLASKRYVSRMQATLMPAWTNWSLMIPGADYEENPQAYQISKGLEKLTRDMFRHVNHSNFYQVLPEALRDMTVSTGAMKIEPGTLDRPFRCTAESMSNLRFEEGPNGLIENVWRTPKIRLGVLERAYPGLQMPDKWQKLLKEKPDHEPDLIEGSLYAPKVDQYVSFLIAKEEKELIWSQINGKGDGANPWVVFRDDKIPGEVLGRGPAMAALADVMTANKVVEFELRNAALATAGAWTAVSDGVLNPYTARVTPGILLPVGSNSNTNPTLKALERSGDFNVANLVLTQLQQNIKLAFLNSLRRAEGPVKTATEIAIDDRDLLMEEHATFGRLQTELVDRTVQRFLRIMQDLGLSPVIKIDGREVTLKHTSPLSRIQDSEEVLSIQRFYEVGNATVGPEVMALSTNIQAVPKQLAKRLGVPAELLRSDEEIAELQQQAAAVAQQQMAAQPAPV
jgi:hypothetical protein